MSLEILIVEATKWQKVQPEWLCATLSQSLGHAEDMA